jgi:hypothetical protein
MRSEKLITGSDDDNERLFVIEKSILIDESMSEIIGKILNIDWKKSKSFGYTSSALSFNQKVQIIQDIKGIEKEDLKKLTCLMYIRNKFAHVLNIRSFEDLFTKSDTGKEKQTNIIKWYFGTYKIPDIPPKHLEKVYLLCFSHLIVDIIEFLYKILGNHYYALGEIDGEKQYKDEFLNETLKYLKSQAGGKKALYDILDRINHTLTNKWDNKP